ncbi:restriction endonuclease subunit S [Thermodesulfovibrio sp.]|uniref:restriction endonuclease subunit S n=1 Tax=Thermodesulfovibrio sp. TaxID=2067987 RepID=UPI0030A61996
MEFVFSEETRFKETEIGLIPEDWQVVRLGEVITDVISGDWGEEIKKDGYVECYVLRGTDFVNIESGLYNKIPKRYIKKNSFEKRQIVNNDILIELSGGGPDQPTGRVFLATNNFLEKFTKVCFSNFIKKLKLDTKIDPVYFFRNWQNLYNNGKTRIYEKRTTGIRNFKLKDFIDKEFIPLPPLPEQKAIAEVLRTIQEAKEKTEAVLKATKELKKSMMKHLFSYGNVSLSDVDKVKLKETEIGPIPEHWQVVRLGEVAEIVMGQSPPGTSYNQSGIGPPFLQGKAEFGNMYPKVINYTTMPIKHAKIKSILLSVRAPVGEVNIADKEYCIGRGLSSISFKNNLGINFFLFYYLVYSKKTIEEMGSGSTFKAINKSQVKNLLIPLPPLSEQQAIADILLAIDEKIQKEEEKKKAIENLFKSMLQNLMSGKIRVQKMEA